MYFALPHHLWQRGANKNANGLVREYFPKSSDFARVGDDEVAAVYDALKCRPCKRLGFRTTWRSTAQMCCTCSDNSRIIS